MAPAAVRSLSSAVLTIVIARLRSCVRSCASTAGIWRAQGAVSYLFNEVGRLTFPPGTDAVRVAAVALEAGAEDVIPAPLEVLTDPIEFDTVRAVLQAAGSSRPARK